MGRDIVCDGPSTSRSILNGEQFGNFEMYRYTASETLTHSPLGAVNAMTGARVPVIVQCEHKRGEVFRAYLLTDIMMASKAVSPMVISREGLVLLTRRIVSYDKISES